MQQEVQTLLRAFGFAGAPAPVHAAAPAPEPAPMPAVAVLLGEGQETADRALMDLSNMYRELQLQAGRILTIFGANAPCEVINRHYQSVESYMQAASDIFQQLTAQGFTVVQKLFNLQGQQVGEQKGPMPVRPAYFEPCRTGTGVNGLGRFVGRAQFGRVILNLGVVPNDGGFGAFPLVAVVIIALIAGGTAVAVTHTIMVNLPSQPVKQVQAQGVWMDNYLSCVERTMKSQSMSHEKADVHCRGLTPAPEAPKPAVSIDPTMLLIGVGVLALLAIGGAYAYREYKRRRGLEPMMLPAPAPTAGFVFENVDAVGDVELAAPGDQAYLMEYPCR